MKGNKKVLVIAVLLLLIAVSYTTYAIYKTSVSTNAEVTAAIWDVNFEDNSTVITDSYDVTFGASDCTSAHVKPGKIAPGATCTKTITLNAGTSEVDVTYNATADTASITAEKGGATVATAGANEFTATLTPASDTITYNNGTRTKDITLTVTWAGTEGDTVDPKDTALNGATITVPVTLVAKQVVGS